MTYLKVMETPPISHSANLLLVGDTATQSSECPPMASCPTCFLLTKSFWNPVGRGVGSGVTGGCCVWANRSVYRRCQRPAQTGRPFSHRCGAAGVHLLKHNRTPRVTIHLFKGGHIPGSAGSCRHRCSASNLDTLRNKPSFLCTKSENRPDDGGVS